MNAWRVPKAESFPHFYACILFSASWALHVYGPSTFIGCLIVASYGVVTMTRNSPPPTQSGHTNSTTKRGEGFLTTEHKLVPICDN